MARRYIGEDSLDINGAFRQFAEARSFEDLSKLVEEQEVFRSPAFHAALRQEHMRLRNEKAPDLDAFLGHYEAMGVALHFRAFRERCVAIREEEPAPEDPTADRYVPPFHAGVLELLDGGVPPRVGRPLDPREDRAEVLRVLSESSGSEVELPEHDPPAGTAWTLVELNCARCDHAFAGVRAHAVDLRASPEARELLLAGRLEPTRCPQCGEACAWPGVPFLEDPPQNRDPLASWSCAVRIEPGRFVYVPPPGTVRDEQWDRVIEMRLERRLTHLGWLDREEMEGSEGPQVLEMAVAYSMAELVHRVEAPDRNDETGIPRAMETMVLELIQKVGSGQLPLHEAEQYVFDILPAVAAEWPVVPPPHASEARGNFAPFIVQALVAEGVAKAKDEDPAIRALLAGHTGGIYMAMSEYGAAEAALARSEDHIARIPADDTRRAAVEAAYADARADLLKGYGRIEEADEVREGVDLESWMEGDEFDERLMRAVSRASAALDSYQRDDFVAALEAFPPSLAELQQLLEEAQASDDESVRAQVDTIRRHVSGATANFASALTACADHAEVAGWIYNRTPPEEVGPAPAPPERAVEVLEAVRAPLRRLLPGGIAPEKIRLAALELYERALATAEEVEALDYAGIQAHRLMLLNDRLGRTEGAESAAAKVIEFAEAVGDHVRARGGHLFLASKLLERELGADALENLEMAATHLVSEAISLGFQAESGVGAEVLTSSLFQAASQGADPGRVATTVESLKAATTAATLSTGFPTSAEGEGNDALTQALDEALHEREQLRLEAMWGSGEDESAAELAQLERELDELRREIGLRDPRFAAWVDATGYELSDVKGLRRRLADHGPRTSFVGLSAVGEQLWSLWLNGEEAVVEELEPGSPPEAFFAPWASRIAKLEPDELLVISPCAGYSTVPFAALEVEGTPLCERVSLCLVQGAGLLEAFHARGLEDHASVLAVGGPSRVDRDDLPGARAEVERVRELVGDDDSADTLFVGANATLTNLVANSDRFDVLHLACHAEPGGPEGERARLLLAPDLVAGDSGILSEDRVLGELRLRPGCFVNLAGCSTGVQRESEGPLLGGLVPAFLVAGAGSVLSSVEPIADGSAVRFQEAFYEELRKGAGPARSLARCQRACLRGELGDELERPEAWSNYVLYGLG